MTEERKELWFSTPEGPMRQFEIAPGPVPGHWYMVKESHWRAFPDSAVKPTRAPTWYRKETMGERLLEARREARKAT